MKIQKNHGLSEALTLMQKYINEKIQNFMRKGIMQAPCLQVNQ